VNRSLVLLGLVLCGLAGTVLTAAGGADTGGLLGRELTWAESYFRMGGLLFGGLGLAGGLALVGVGAGHWRQPLPVGNPTREGLRE
jgi:hypothetical protein